MMRVASRARAIPIVPFLLFGAVPCLRAQLSHTAVAQNTFTCTAGPNSDSIPAGDSLAPSNGMSAFYSPSGFLILQATGSYQTTTAPASLGFSLTESDSVYNLFGGSYPVGTGPNQSLWVIHSQQPVTGTLQVTGSTTSSAVFNSAVAAVDVDDDGSVEWSLTTGGPLQLPLTVNGARTIRVTTSTNAVLGTLQLHVDLTFSVDAAKASYGAGCGAPLSLDSNLPVLGLGWVLTTTGVDAVSPIVVTFFGDRGPAVPFAAIGLDAPGCAAHLQSVLGALTGPSAGGSASVTVTVPTAPALVGVRLAGQSVCLTANNPAGLLSSNGLEGTIGG